MLVASAPGGYPLAHPPGRPCQGPPPWAAEYTAFPHAAPSQPRLAAAGPARIANPPGPWKIPASQPLACGMSNPAAVPSPPRHRLRIVVADDNADLARVLGDVIDGEPDLACVARVGAADRVVAVVRESSADVLLLDVRLHGGTGLELLEQIRRDLPAVRVLVFSGYARPELEEEARRRGAAGFVAKSGDLDGLLATIRTLGGLSAAAPPH